MKGIFLLGFMLLVGACSGRPPPAEVLIHAGRVFDGLEVHTQMRILIRDGEIVELAADATEPAPSTDERLVIDARNLTVMPGLIDAHTHLLPSGSCTPGVDAGLRQANRNLRALLRAGVTTVADLGSPPAVAVGLRDFVGTAQHRGPRVLVAGPLLTAEGGYLTEFQDGELVEVGMITPLPSAEAARAEVIRLADLRVDLIKVALQEIHYDGTPIQMLSQEVLCEVVNTAHAQNLRVLAHAMTRAAYEQALACNVDAIVHGGIEYLPDDTINLLAKRQTPVAPTLMVLNAPLWGLSHPEYLQQPWVKSVLGKGARKDLQHYLSADDPESPTIPDFFMPGLRRQAIQQAVANNMENAGRMFDAGVPIALGTDSANCFHPAGSVVQELRRMYLAGMENVPILASATSTSAKLLNLQDALGRIAVGYRADLIGIDGAPDISLDEIEQVSWVMIDGVLQRMQPPSMSDTLGLTARVIVSWLRGS